MRKYNWARNERGAIDLASIMVGVIVIGLIGGVVSATVFAVIPWAQDNAAKQQLDSVSAAQSAYRGLTSSIPLTLNGPEGMHKANSYGDSNQLSTAGLLAQDSNYCTLTTDNGNGYQAFSKSSSGQVFTITDQSTKPSPLEGVTDNFVYSLPSNCGTVFSDVERFYEPDTLVMTYSSPVDVTVELPIRGGSGEVIWSDAPSSPQTYNSSTIISKELTAGEDYKVTVKGDIPSVDYRDRQGAGALKEVIHWGENTGTTNAAYAFHNAANLTNIPDNIPRTITNATKMFSGATQLNDTDVANWDVSNMKHLNHMFENTAINADLSGWDLTNAVNAAFILNDKWSIPQANYTALEKTTTLTYRCPTTKRIELPIRNTTSAVTFTWSDGFMNDAQAGSYRQPMDGTAVVPTYSRELIKDQTYTVVVEGTYNVLSYATISSNNPAVLAGNDCLLSLDHWGEKTGVTTANRGFYGVPTEFTVPSNLPSTVTVTRSMFSNAHNFNDPNVTKWDTSKVTDMAWMFSVARNFNQDLSNWNTSSLTNMKHMFSYANSFNQPLNKWDTSKVTDMERVFFAAGGFNQDLSSWNVSNVTNMEAMFQSATAFNQNISSWNVSKVTAHADFRTHSGLAASNSPF